MIKVSYETSMEDFEAWGGGANTLDDIRNADKMDELEELAEEVFPDGTESETEINDWLWFDREDIYESLGLNENGNLIDEEDEETSLKSS